jgi:hypothetical protein
MKTTLVTLASIGLVVVLLAAPHALAQEEAQQPSVFEGQLLLIDPDMQSIVVGQPEGLEEPMTISYNADTAVVGSIEDVQGLNGQAGAQLRVTYEALGESYVATTIEVVSLPQEEL